MSTPKNQLSEGVIYIATGEKCLAEALQSVRSLKAANPGISATLFTDRAGNYLDFEQVFPVENPRYSSLDKLNNIHRSPYDKTLYLDTDTHVVDDITDVFTLLNRFDFAGMIEISRGYWYRQYTNIPDSFPEINSGVLAFRKCPLVDQLFVDWRNFYTASLAWQESSGGSNRIWDQPGLRQALYSSPELKLSTLPTEYNAFQLNGTYLWGKAKILHTRNPHKPFAASLNRHPDRPRVYLQQIGTYTGWANMSCAELLNFGMRANAVVVMGVVRHLSSLFKRTARKETGPVSTPLQQGGIPVRKAFRRTSS